MTELEKLKAGLAYRYDDPEIVAIKESAMLWNAAYNALSPTDYEGQTQLLKRHLGRVGDAVWIARVFQCDNGKNIFIGHHFTGNYNLTILDVGEVHIGNHVMIGPNTLITTVNHPLDAEGRRNYLGIVSPVYIEDDVWIGGQVTILPGVHIGCNAVVAAGAVVTKDVPANSLIGGVPARLLRNL